jgi:hypothetical protein
MELGKFIGLALLRFLSPVQLHYRTQEHAGEFPPRMFDAQTTNWERNAQERSSLFTKKRDRPQAHPALFILLVKSTLCVNPALLDGERHSID